MAGARQLLTQQCDGHHNIISCLMIVINYHYNLKWDIYYASVMMTDKQKLLLVDVISYSHISLNNSILKQKIQLTLR